MKKIKQENQLDTFAKKYIKEIPAEKAPDDFTATLMAKINVSGVKSVFKTKALISKKVWFFIASIFIALLVFPFKNSSELSLSIPEMNFSFLEINQLPNILDLVSLSNSLLVTFFLFGLMIIGQVIYLKNHFDKRFEI